MVCVGDGCETYLFNAALSYSPSYSKVSEASLQVASLAYAPGLLRSIRDARYCL